jgi:hypothetical protein
MKTKTQARKMAKKTTKKIKTTKNNTTDKNNDK